MIFTQAQLFAREDQSLAPYAIRSSQSKGRQYEEIDDPYRTPFQRDRDRIIHCKAFRRLRGKTQVFPAFYGDHYRSRLSHSIEVSQVSRDIARALGLNEDLCETIALAHDLGHTPFGHAGQDAMHEIMTKYDDAFEHNRQSRRVVEVLEEKSPDYPGLNLTFETLEGLRKHDPIVHSLEAQLVDHADAIAYHHHDLDDGLRASLFSYDELESELELWRIAVEELDRKKLGENLFRHMAITHVISLLINDLTEETLRRIQKNVLKAPPSKSEHGDIVGFSDRMQKRADALAEFLGERFYLHPLVLDQVSEGQKTIKSLFQAYAKDPTLMPNRIRIQLDGEKTYIVIKDYIAGMTDAYAMKKLAECKK